LLLCADFLNVNAMNDEILNQNKQMAVYPMDNGRISLDEVMRALGQNA